MYTSNTKKYASIPSRQFVFSDEIIKDILNKQNFGYTLRRHENPWWKNQVGVRRAGVNWAWTEEEIEEYTKCKLDIYYFAEKYCKIKLEDGTIDHPKLRDYQKDIIDLFTNNRYSILMASRQSGKTISVAITMLHYVTFNNDKGALIVANKSNTVIEIMDKIKNIYKNLPFFLKVGVITWNMRSLAFENGCRIKTEARTKEPSIGFTIDFLYLDEFAHVPNTIADKFYKSVVPTVSSIENSKIIITSTPNGYNLFHKLWDGANLPKGDPKKNPYKPLVVYWWQVPGRRDTKLYLFNDELRRNKVTVEDIQNHFKELGVDTYFKREQKEDGTVENVFMVKYIDKVSTIDVVRETAIKNVPLIKLANITNWEEQETLLIGGKDAFDQEYNLHFMSGSQRLFTSTAFKEIESNKKEFEYRDIDLLTYKLNFEYKELRWKPDYNLGSLKLDNIIFSIDLAEGLGLNYSVINMFKLVPKSLDSLKGKKIKNIYESFKLEQIGVYQYNKISIADLASILYLLMFELCDPEKIKVVLEVNKYGGELLSELKHVFNDNNEYGSYVFVRYKHSDNSDDKKIGLKVGSDKNILVKDYVDKLESGSIGITDTESIKEISNFIKHETRAGNIQYRAEVGNDDICMTVVNVSSFFKTVDFKNMVDMIWEQSPKSFQDEVNALMNEGEFVEGANFGLMRNARKMAAGKRRRYGEQAPELKGRWFRK